MVSVTVTAVKGTVVPGGPLKVNCTVNVNVLPKTFDAGFAYHALNALVRGTVTSVEAVCVLVGNAKWKRALVMSRGVERPVTEILNPAAVTVPMVTFVMKGTVGLTGITIGAGGVRGVPFESCRVVVMVIVPATVPIITGTKGTLVAPNKP